MAASEDVPLDAVIDAATQVAIIATDMTGTITHFNTGAERMLGYSRDEVIGRETPVRFHLESEIQEHARRLREEFGDLPPEFPVFVERARRGHYEEREWTYVHRNGTHLNVMLIVTAIRDNLGELVGYVGVARDITDRRATEAALRRGEALKSAILEAALDAVLTIDHTGRVLEFNPAAERIFGYSRDQILGQRLSEYIIPPRFREAHEQGLARYLTTGEGPVLGRRIEIFAQKADGSEIPIELEVVVVPQQSPPIFSAYLRDISDRKRAEEQLRDREARLRSIFETAVDGIVVISDRGMIESFNRGAEQIFGYRADEVIGRNVSLLMPPHDAAAHDQRIADYLATGNSKIIGRPREVRARRREGTEIDIELSISDMRIGSIRKFTGIVRDVTIRNRNRDDLAAKNRLLESIRQAQSMFIAKDRQEDVFEALLASGLRLTESSIGFLGEVLYDDDHQPYLRTRAITNISWDDATHRLYEESLGKGLEFRNLSSLFGRVLADARPLISNDPENDERRGGLPHGHPQLSCFLGVPIMLGPKLVGMIGLAGRPGGYSQEILDYLEPFLSTCAAIIQGDRDEQNRSQAEQDLQVAKQAAEAANRAKSEFLANMSHEVRTPMAAVLGFSEMLLNHGLSAIERDKAIQAIRLNGQHLMQIIDDILDLTKIEAQKLVLEFMTYSPWQIIQEVLSLLRVQAQERNVDLSVEAEGRIPRVARIDPTRVRQILVNFVGNALKFTPRDGSVRVRLWGAEPADDTPATFCITVDDTGIGITPDQIRRLFEPFQQADMSTTRRFGGTGLGLSISLRLAEAMGGHISVASQVGQGSQFTVCIPVGIPTPQIDWVDGSQLDCTWLNSQSAEDSFVLAQLQGRVLLVEDNPDIQTVVAAHLRGSGLDVEVASDGLEAVRKAQAGQFDVVLMDMQMPKLDGYGATSSLRQSGFKAPIIALTAHAFAEDRAKCLKVGCTEHLSKPISRELLLETLGRYLPASNAPTNCPPVSPVPVSPPPVPPAAAPRPAAPPAEPARGFSQLQQGFVARLAERVREMDEALAAGDWTRLCGFAHRLKGSGSMYGFPELTQAAGDLEQAIRGGQTPEAITALARQHAAVCTEIMNRTPTGGV